MSALAFIEIEGRRYLWREVLAARRAQLVARRKAEQPALFELRADRRPTTECTAAGRYREPSLFAQASIGQRREKSPTKRKVVQKAIFEPFARHDGAAYFRRMQLTPDEISRLSPNERLALIAQLWDSLEDDQIPLTTAQQTELERRLTRLDHDRAQSVTWETLKAELAQRCP